MAGTVNPDRMIAVFLAGVLTGAGVVQLTGSSGGGPGGGPGTGPGQQMGQGGGGQGGGGQGGGGQGGGQGGGGQAGASKGGGQGSGAPGGGAGGSGSGGGTGGSGAEGAGGGGSSGAAPGGGAGLSPAAGAGAGAAEEGTVTTGETVNAGSVAGGARGAPRLLKHLNDAPGLWSAQAVAARTSKVPAQLALADEIEAHANDVPAAAGRLPPLQEVTAYVLASQVLLAKMKAAGMEVGALETQLESITKPRGGGGK